MPPLRLGRSVEANGARPACEVTIVPIRDLGKEALSNLTPDREADDVNRRTVEVIAECVVYHRPLLCFNRAMRWSGCFGAFLARIGCSCACVGRAASGNCVCMNFAARRQVALCLLVWPLDDHPIHLLERFGVLDHQPMQMHHVRRHDEIVHRL